jgi:hypothetical protein
MAERNWETRKVIYCDHVQCQVALEVEVVYPSEHMPEQLPRVLSRRCSRGVECNLIEKATCLWAGTNPHHDPFKVVGKSEKR